VGLRYLRIEIRLAIMQIEKAEVLKSWSPRIQSQPKPVRHLIDERSLRHGEPE
jgi:hypothetical protein